MYATVTTTNQITSQTSGSQFRFHKTNRLPDAAAFGRVFKKATRSGDKLFTVLCRDNNEGGCRLGMAISKKLCRKATARNRIKRAIRESFRHHQALLTGLDIVVINQPAAARANNSMMHESLQRHWQRCSKTIRKQPTQDS